MNTPFYPLIRLTVISLGSILATLGTWARFLISLRLLSKIPFIGYKFLNVHDVIIEGAQEVDPFAVGVRQVAPALELGVPVEQHIVEEAIYLPGQLREDFNDWAQRRLNPQPEQLAIQDGVADPIPIEWNDHFYQVVLAHPQAQGLDEGAVVNIIDAMIRMFEVAGQPIHIRRVIHQHLAVNIADIPAGDLAAHMGGFQILNVAFHSIINSAFALVYPGINPNCGTEPTQLSESSPSFREFSNSSTIQSSNSSSTLSTGQSCNSSGSLTVQSSDSSTLSTIQSSNSLLESQKSIDSGCRDSSISVDDSLWTDDPTRELDSFYRCQSSIVPYGSNIPSDRAASAISSSKVCVGSELKLQIVIDILNSSPDLAGQSVELFVNGISFAL